MRQRTTAALDEFETIVSEAAQKGQIDRQRESVIRQFLEEFERQALAEVFPYLKKNRRKRNWIDAS